MLEGMMEKLATGSLQRRCLVLPPWWWQFLFTRQSVIYFWGMLALTPLHGTLSFPFMKKSCSFCMKLYCPCTWIPWHQLITLDILINLRLIIIWSPWRATCWCAFPLDLKSVKISSVFFRKEGNVGGKSVWDKLNDSDNIWLYFHSPPLRLCVLWPMLQTTGAT